MTHFLFTKFYKAFQNITKTSRSSGTRNIRLAFLTTTNRMFPHILYFNLNSPSRTRTYDNSVNSRALYRLSYRGILNTNDIIPHFLKMSTVFLIFLNRFHWTIRFLLINAQNCTDKKLFCSNNQKLCKCKSHRVFGYCCRTISDYYISIILQNFRLLNTYQYIDTIR